MPKLPPSQPSRLAQLLLCGVLVTSCGGGGSNGGTPPGGTAIAKVGGDAQNGIVGQPLATALSVRVTEDGSPSAGATVAWSTTAAGGSVNPASVVTDANGNAETNWTLGTVAGSQSATATLSGASGSPLNFTATAAADVATTLAKAGGDNQTGEVNTQLAAPVQAKVSDQFGNGVAGVSVSWGADGEAAVSADNVPSSTSGISAVTVTLGGNPGPITITATSGTLAGSPLGFTATATSAPTGTTIQVGNGAGVGPTQAVFVPSTVTIAVGETVTWVWNSGTTLHNVSTSSGSPSIPGTPSQTTASPFTFGPVTFTVAGTYTFYCSVHAGPTNPVSPGVMVGQVTVQ